MEVELRPGDRSVKRWWHQEGLELEGAPVVVREAEAEEQMDSSEDGDETRD